jgi:hypothetical protein
MIKWKRIVTSYSNNEECISLISRLRKWSDRHESKRFISCLDNKTIKNWFQDLLNYSESDTDKTELKNQMLEYDNTCTVFPVLRWISAAWHTEYVI